MAFSLPTFIRLTDTELLKSYLADQQLGLPSCLRRGASKKELIATLVGLIEGLDVGHRNRVYRHFEQVEQLVGEVEGSLFQVSVFIEGSPETQSVFDADGVSTNVVTPALEAAVLYDASERRLEVAGRGGKAVLDRLASTFTRHILVSEEHPEGIVPLRYNLERLKRPHGFVFEPSDDLKDVKLTLLKLHGDDAGHARVTLEVGPEADIDIWTAADAWFTEMSPLRIPGWRVRQAHIKVAFHKAPGERREKTIKIDLRFPYGCNLKDQIERERLLAEKYLKRWGLVDEVSGTSSAVA